VVAGRLTSFTVERRKIHPTRAESEDRLPTNPEGRTSLPDAREVSVAGGRGWSERLRRPSSGHDDPLRQLGRFLLVGLGNTALSFVVYRLLLVVGTPYVLAAPLAFAAGALNGYVFNRSWTFAARDSMRARLLYVVVQGAGALSTSLLVLFFVRVAETGRVWAYLAAIPPVTLSTFAANRLWTFAEPS
jgi:putative flippase GtrA